jgi:hypothetical protein
VITDRLVVIDDDVGFRHFVRVGEAAGFETPDAALKDAKAET